MTAPVDGGAATTETTTPEVTDGGDGSELTPPAANNWWQFGTKEDAESWANNLVTKRLSRDRKANLEPLQQTNATLEAEVARLKPLAERAMSEDEKRDANLAAAQQELEELRNFKAQAARKELVNGIAEEVGLPAHLTAFLTDGDADSIREQATNLLNALSEGGSNTGKRVPPSKAPAPTAGDENGGGTTASSGGGGNGSEPSDEELIAQIRDATAEIRKNGGFSVHR
ncbi:DUF4355 domain-containing protein [Mycobacterium sp. AZCC_0083]|uniref:capsid assembly scaffolding protein Gp46 family protein n=1 Tax=Mycobacterium sp. AZCC_0083 TaxID=2735882 RepID=UPI00161814F9|nr:DUF4355 domain-containing protein [Mycobacterium sp. AZCC_0083]MBB5167211.1 hypothetical protein [Mycobacterium sp. AZCC_0083]